VNLRKTNCVRYESVVSQLENRTVWLKWQH